MSAEHAYVLTPTDVRNIRSYVQIKYASMPQNRRAEIVADAVTRIIHKQLPDFELPIKHQLTSKLIRETVLQEQRPVKADDIFMLCMELDRENPSIAIPLAQWVRKQETNLTGEHSNETIAVPAATANETEEATLSLPQASARLLSGIRRKRMYLFSLLCAILVGASALYAASMTVSNSIDKEPQSDGVAPAQPAPDKPAAVLNELPDVLRYEAVDQKRLIAYLDRKSSILAEPNYYNAIIRTARDFDIHPALLFAITGQEQAFVPKSNDRAKEIANNPFNVFHSWKEFNTTIEESAQIAARTINRLSKDRPLDVDPFTWINREYAEDPNWANGVRSIFTAIVEDIKPNT